MTVKPDFEPIRLDSFLPYQLTLLAHRIARETASIARRHEGLNLSHWRVLAAVADAPGSTANDVVAATPMDKGIVSRAVKALIGLGLLRRAASDTDGRVGHLFLTDKGDRLYRSIAEEVLRFDTALTADLSVSERSLLSDALRKLARSLTG